MFVSRWCVLGFLLPLRVLHRLYHPFNCLTAQIIQIITVLATSDLRGHMVHIKTVETAYKQIPFSCLKMLHFPHCLRLVLLKLLLKSFSVFRISTGVREGREFYFFKCTRSCFCEELEADE